jgi:hypothetical protein
MLKEELLFWSLLGGGAGGVGREVCVLPVRITGRGARAGLRTEGVDVIGPGLLSSTS